MLLSVQHNCLLGSQMHERWTSSACEQTMKCQIHLTLDQMKQIHSLFFKWMLLLHHFSDFQVMPALLARIRPAEEGWSKPHVDDLVEKLFTATFPAFKFPDRERLHVTCGVQLCREECPYVSIFLFWKSFFFLNSSLLTSLSGFLKIYFLNFNVSGRLCRNRSICFRFRSTIGTNWSIQFIGRNCTSNWIGASTKRSSI